MRANDPREETHEQAKYLHISDSAEHVITQFLRSPVEKGIYIISSFWRGSNSVLDALSLYIKELPEYVELAHKRIEDGDLGAYRNTISKESVTSDDATQLIRRSVAFLFSVLKFRHTSGSERLSGSLPNKASLLYRNLLKVIGDSLSDPKYDRSHVVNQYGGFSQLDVDIREGRIWQWGTSCPIYPIKLPDAESDVIELVSPDLAALASLCSLWQSLGLHVSPPRALYSPEEELYRQYFEWFGAVRDRALPFRLHYLFDKAHLEFNDHRFDVCVSNLGLLAEDCMIEIYETLHRTRCPERLTLGQLVDRVATDALTLFPRSSKSSKAAPDLDELYKKISSLSLDVQIDLPRADLIAVLRGLVTAVKYERYERENCNKTNEVQARDIYPRQVRKALDELIGYRNAVSHRTRVLVKEHEAQRAAYCVFVLVTWWRAKLAQYWYIQDKMEILRKMVEDPEAAW